MYDRMVFIESVDGKMETAFLYRPSDVGFVDFIHSPIAWEPNLYKKIKVGKKYLRCE